MAERLVRVEGMKRGKGKGPGRPFVAAFLYDDQLDRCVHSAPILKHLVGKSINEIRAISAEQGWRMTVLRVP
jgi:hypothetical protein